MPRRAWLATLLLPTLLASVLLSVAGASSAAAAAPFATNTTWQWAYASIGRTANATQVVQATIGGASNRDRNGGLVLRKSSPGQFAVVNFSGTKYQIFLATNGHLSLAFEKPFRSSTKGVARAEVSGATITASWNGSAVSTNTVEALRTFRGTGAGLAIWQDRARAVSISTVSARSPATPAQAPASTRKALSTPRGWLSGAAGDGAATGRFGAWRGSAIEIGGTWNDTFEAQTAQYSLQSGADWGTWQGDLDVAVGAIYKDRGESWSAAAAGEYDARWRTALTTMRDGWADRPGTLHIRFAHEFNGDWVPWAVSGAETTQFVTAWKRFRALQQRILPRHKLVFCPNDGSSESLGIDWRDAFPGAASVDEMAVDSYNNYPWVNTVADFGAKITKVDGFGAPVGIERHRQFAAAVGRPLAISEWSSNSSKGDAPVYVSEFHRWVTAHAGTGAGQVPYEIMFNVGSYGRGVFQVFPSTRQAEATGAYARLW